MSMDTVRPQDGYERMFAFRRAEQLVRYFVALQLPQLFDARPYFELSEQEARALEWSGTRQSNTVHCFVDPAVSVAERTHVMMYSYRDLGDYLEVEHSKVDGQIVHDAIATAGLSEDFEHVYPEVAEQFDPATHLPGAEVLYALHRSRRSMRCQLLTRFIAEHSYS